MLQPARKRFLHILGSAGLTAIPSTFPLLRSTLAGVLVPVALRDAVAYHRRVLHTSDDVSIDAFLQNSSVTSRPRVHIDIRQRDRARHLCGGLTSAERACGIFDIVPARGGRNGNIARGVICAVLSASWRKQQDVEVRRDGEYLLGCVVQLMKSRLREHDNVADGAALLQRQRTGFELTTESGKRCTSSHVICAITHPAWAVSSQTVRIPATFQA
ncbi:hypothetical protein C8Q76DRAFT_795234 [Earliella scabrosa]|nr:hypothetical protein C8Q76DRAFT_795234 [Earliella scabrosa]